MRTPLLLVVLVNTVGCGKPAAGPKSEAEFMEAYRAAYNAGDKAAVLALVKWERCSR